MKARGYYSNGLKRGNWKWYDFSNTLRIEMKFNKDIPYGISNIYNENGKLIEEILEIN